MGLFHNVKGLRMFSWRLSERIFVVQPRGTGACGGAVFHYADDNRPSGETSGIPDQAVPRTLAGGRSPVCWSYGHKPIIPLETRTKAIELMLGGIWQKQATERLGVNVGDVHNWATAYREGDMAALQPRNRNSTASPTSPRLDEAGTPGMAVTTRRRCVDASRS